MKKKNDIINSMKMDVETKPWPVGYLVLAWLGSLAGLLGSLYFSEIRDFPPCVLCWYQRICMYPLALLIPIGITSRDRFIYRYTLPLAVTGLGIAIYHNLLYYNILPEAAAPCLAGVSCTTKFVEYFGFVTIPLMAGIGFLGLTILLLLFRKRVLH